MKIQCDLTASTLHHLWETTRCKIETSNGLKLSSAGSNKLKTKIWSHTFEATKDEILNNLPSDSSLRLTVHFKIMQSAQQMDLSKDIASLNIRMLEGELFCDFKFIVKGKDFNVHQSVLAAASPVFANLFITNILEGNEKHSKVENLEPEIFNYLLRFIYGKILPMKFRRDFTMLPLTMKLKA
jgi:BTB/POZ domain